MRRPLVFCLLVLAPHVMAAQTPPGGGASESPQECGLPPFTTSGPVDLAGHWEGTVEIPGPDINVRLNVAVEPSGQTFLLSLLESRLECFPVPNASFDAASGALRLEVPKGWGLAMFSGLGLKPEDEVIVFEGKVAGDSAQGTLRLGTETFPLVLRRGSRALDYRFEHVTFRNGDVTLAGSLLLPEGKGPFPVVVFTHGSGSRTRDAHRFEAEALAGRGIAALIYDKRGTGGSTGASWEWASFAELADDAEAAVLYVRGRPEFTGRRIGLFGLSQGAWLIEMVAARCPDVGFLIVVSGGGVPTWQQELFYRANNMRADGFPEADVTEAVQFMRKKFEVARTGVGWSSIEAAAREFERSGKKWYPSHTGGMTTMTSARLWWLLVFSHDPAPFLRKIKSPLLGLFAGDDRVMPTADSVGAIERALSEAANREFTLKVIDDAYHSMGLPQRLNARPLRRVVSDDYMHALLDWTAGQARRHEPGH